MYSTQAKSFQTSGWPIGHIPVKSIRMLLNESCGTYWAVELLLGVIYFVFRAIEFHAISDHRPNWAMGIGHVCGESDDFLHTTVFLRRNFM